MRYFHKLIVAMRPLLAFSIAYVLLLQSLTFIGLAQAAPPNENINIFGSDKAYLPSAAKITNQISGRVINLSVAENGYDFNSSGCSTQNGTVNYQTMQSASYSQLEMSSVKSNSAATSSYSFSVHLSLPSLNSQPAREFSMNGMIEDSGENGFKLDGNLSNLDGTLVEKVKVEISGDSLSPAYKQYLSQTSRAINPFNPKDKKMSFIPAKYTKGNLFFEFGCK